MNVGGGGGRQLESPVVQASGCRMVQDLEVVTVTTKPGTIAPAFILLVVAVTFGQHLVWAQSLLTSVWLVHLGRTG